jgi:hypothetical protein
MEKKSLELMATDQEKFLKKNYNLGLYDMVMAMSESSINFLLKSLMDDGIIKDSWSVRMIVDKHDNPLEVIIGESKDDYYKAFEMAAGKTKMQGFYSTLNTFKIKITKEKFSLLFLIPFKRGTLNYSYKGDDSESYGLDGMVYAFMVDLKKMSQSYEQFEKNKSINEPTKEAINNAIKEMSSPKIKSEDFTIESLFLDLENANYELQRREYLSKIDE